MNLSIRGRFYAAIVVWFGFAFPLGILGVNVSNFFLLAVVLLMIVAGIYTMHLKCPACGQPIGKVGVLWTAWVPKDCRVCGHSLTEK
jgi:hypothetical protein